MKKKLKIGVLLNSEKTDFHTFTLLEKIKDNPLFESPIIISGYIDNRYKKDNFLHKIFRLGILYLTKRLIYLILYKLITFLELKLVLKTFKNYNKFFDISKNKYKKIFLKGAWSKSKLILSFSKKEVSKIKDEGFDVLIRCGSGILKGDILKAPKFGVLSFHHGDNRLYRGGPCGFWESLNKEDSIGFIIQRLNEELDGGDVLFRGNICTHQLWLMNHAKIMEKTPIFMIKILSYIALNDKLPDSQPPSLYDRKLYSLRII